MHKSILTGAVLAGGALLFSAGAFAIPIHVGLVQAAGHTSWNSGPISDPIVAILGGFTARNPYQSPPPCSTAPCTPGAPSSTANWTPKPMTYAPQPAAPATAQAIFQSPVPATDPVPVSAATTPYTGGLGVSSCTVGQDFCTDDVINGAGVPFGQPWDMIDMRVTGSWKWLRFNLLRDDPNTASFDMWGGSCAVGTSGCDTLTDGMELTGCTTDATTGTVTCTFSKQYLSDMGVTDLWITPFTIPDANGVGLDYGNVYLQGDIVVDIVESVPEPSALGMFGLGVLLLGLCASLWQWRRHRAA